MLVGGSWHNMKCLEGIWGDFQKGILIKCTIYCVKSSPYFGLIHITWIRWYSCLLFEMWNYVSPVLHKTQLLCTLLKHFYRDALPAVMPQNQAQKPYIYFIVVRIRCNIFGVNCLTNWPILPACFRHDSIGRYIGAFLKINRHPNMH